MEILAPKRHWRETETRFGRFLLFGNARFGAHSGIFAQGVYEILIFEKILIEKQSQKQKTLQRLISFFMKM